MGIMTAAVMNYTVNPVWNYFKKLIRAGIRSQARVGRARAAAELARMGLYEESKRVMMQELDV